MGNRLSSCWMKSVCLSYLWCSNIYKQSPFLQRSLVTMQMYLFRWYFWLENFPSSLFDCNFTGHNSIVDSHLACTQIVTKELGLAMSACDVEFDCNRKLTGQLSHTNVHMNELCWILYLNNFTWRQRRAHKHINKANEKFVTFCCVLCVCVCVWALWQTSNTFVILRRRWWWWWINICQGARTCVFIISYFSQLSPKSASNFSFSISILTVCLLFANIEYVETGIATSARIPSRM